MKNLQIWGGLLLMATILHWSSCSVKPYEYQGQQYRSATELAMGLFDSPAGHSGLLVVEADNPNQDPLVDFHSESLFTPASNTKILTLVSALKHLPQRLSGLHYIKSNDTTYIRGTADPGFLDPRFESTDVLDFLRDQTQLVFISDWDSDRRWGSGWSWDDYPYYYSPQLSPFPIYGNMVRAWCEDGKWKMSPDSFIRNQIRHPGYYRVKRHEHANIFQLNSARCVEDTIRIPFVWEPELLTDLLGEAVGQKVDWLPSLPGGVQPDWQSIPGSGRDTLLKAMMYDSDNFIAEQMMMNMSVELWDTLQLSQSIDTMMNSDFENWKDKIRWVDGSGLSIYNKFSPTFLVRVLKQLYDSTPREHLWGWFPAGGERGTIKYWYGHPEGAYVYAKTGTLSAVHCLSGYLKADSGRIYILSFMHNNYLGSSNLYKDKMQILLEYIKQNY